MKALIILLFSSVVLALPAMAHDGHGDVTESAFRADKDGHVKISENLKAGTIVIKKGRYSMAHRVEEARHVVSLTSVEAKPGVEAVVYEIATSALASRTRVSKTAIYAAELPDTTLQVTVIQFAGENNDHMPQNGERGVAASF